MAFNTAGFLFLFFPRGVSSLPAHAGDAGRRTFFFCNSERAVLYGFGGLASLPVLFAAFLWDYLFGRLIAKDEKASEALVRHRRGGQSGAARVL